MAKPRKRAKKSTKKRAKKSTKRKRSKTVGCQTVMVCGNRRKLCFKKTKHGIRITSNKPA